MPSQGPNSASSAANATYVGSVTSWDDPGEALNNNDSPATAGFGSGGSSSWLLITQFGFALPGGSTVTDVSATFRAQTSTAGIDLYAQMVVSGSGIGDEASAGTPDRPPYADFPAAWDSVTMGGLSAAQVNDTTFGVRVRGEALDIDRLDIDYVTMSVTYVEGVTTTTRRIKLRKVG